MNHTRAITASVLVVASLVCVSIVFAKPKVSLDQAKYLCGVKSQKEYDACVKEHPRGAYGCDALSQRVYLRCLANYGYDSPVPRRGSDLPTGPLNDRAKTTTNAKAKQHSSPTPSPTGTPKAKRTPKNKH